MDFERLNAVAKSIGVRVVDSIPGDVCASDVIRASMGPDKGGRITWKKNGVMFASAPSPRVLWQRMDAWKQEIEARKDWTERVEDWECYLDGVYNDLKRSELLEMRKTEYDKVAQKEGMIPADFLGLNPQFEEHVRSELAKRGKQSD